MGTTSSSHHKQSRKGFWFMRVETRLLWRQQLDTFINFGSVKPRFRVDTTSWYHNLEWKYLQDCTQRFQRFRGKGKFFACSSSSAICSTSEHFLYLHTFCTFWHETQFQSRKLQTHSQIVPRTCSNSQILFCGQVKSSGWWQQSRHHNVWNLISKMFYLQKLGIGGNPC